MRDYGLEWCMTADDLDGALQIGVGVGMITMVAVGTAGAIGLCQLL